MKKLILSMAALALLAGCASKEVKEQPPATVEERAPTTGAATPPVTQPPPAAKPDTVVKPIIQKPIVANPLTDPGNCGGCGIVCSTGQCLASSCGQAGCPMGLELCDGLCTDTKFDPDNCGACGNRCQPGRSCRGGRCR